jgi:GxxExxY protein
MGLHVEQQFPLPVYDEDGTILGDYKADLFVEHCLVVEIKAYRTLIDDNIAQLLGYLRSSKIEHGLLINFGSTKLQIKKYVLSSL